MLYKPLVALVMSIGLTLMQSGTLIGALAGAASVFLSAFGLGPLMKVFGNLNFSGGIGTGASLGAGALAGRSNATMGAPTGAADG